MIIDRIWGAARTFVPLQLYPFLAPVYRWRRRSQLKQLEEHDRSYLAAHPGAIAPPAELRYNVVGPCTIEQFMDAGRRVKEDIDRALSATGRRLAEARDFLDFGCGCGRLELALRAGGLDLQVTACDVDARAIRWCQENLRGETYVVNAELPPLPFAGGAFDVAWAGSVFTHLDEPHQDQWLAEVCRVLKPGGVLLASVHGPHLWEPRLPAWTIAKLKKDGIVFAKTAADAGVHPAWYQVAWHTESYIRDHWARYFEICGYLPRGLNDYQDIVVARKRG
jgi:SAM-dependent methyltransferase